MPRTRRYAHRRLAIFIVVLVLGLAARPASGACLAPLQITSVESDGSRSFIWTDQVFLPDYYVGSPGYAPAMYPDGNPPFTRAFEGVFWSVGHGDPVVGLGDDNGSFAVDDPLQPWLSYYALPSYLYYEAAELFTTWAADSAIDGCLFNGGPGGETCTCVLLTDQDGTEGYYAILGNSTTPGHDTYLAQPGSDGNGNRGPIVLQAIPWPLIVGAHRNPASGGISIDVMVVESPGSYVLDPDRCPCGPVGFKVVQRELPRGSAPPGDRNAALWQDAPLEGGGVQPVTPLGRSVPIESNCGLVDDVEVYLATRLYFDSGFASSVVSRNSTRIECGPNVADPSATRRPPGIGGRGEARPQRERPRTTYRRP
jgi:hypothetical protein